MDSADITSFADVAAFTGLTSLTLDGCTGCTELDITASASLTSVSAPSVTKLTMTAAQATTFNVTKGVDATHSESLTLAEGYSIYVDGVCFAGVDYVADVIFAGGVLTVNNVSSVGLTNAAIGAATDDDGNDTSCYQQNTYHIAMVDSTTYTTRAAAVKMSGLNDVVTAAVTAGEIDKDYLDSVTKIVVKGVINAADFSYLYGRFATVDLSGATITGYSSSQNSSNAKATCTPFKCFQEDTTLKELSLPSNLTVVGYRLCCDATNVTTVTLPSTLTDMQYYAFYGAKSLATVNWADLTKLTTFGAGVFRNTAITSVVLPSTVTTFGTLVFNGCSSLSSFTVNWSTIPSSFIPALFDGTNATSSAVALTVPKGTSSSYTTLGFTNVTEAAE